MVRSDGADRQFHLIIAGSNTAESGPPSPQLAMQLAKGFVYASRHGEVRWGRPPFSLVL